MKLFAFAIFFACFISTFGKNFEGYVFVHFIQEAGYGDREVIYLSASQGNNALNWTELNNGEPILVSKEGTAGLRDPFIIRSEEGDKFYLLATDLSSSADPGWKNATRFGSRYIEIWESTDLVNWSKQHHTLVAPPSAGCSWAPEAHYDKDLGKYIVYFASTMYSDDDTTRTGPTYHRLIYAATKDFKTFEEPKVWQDSGNMRIDTSVYEENGIYYRFTVGGINGCHDIFQEYSRNLTAPVQDWKLQLSCLSKKIGSAYIEGPTCFKSNPGDERGQKYHLFVDEPGRRGYIPLETDDIANPDWKISSDYKLPGSSTRQSRHGTVMPVTAEELERVKSALKHRG